MKNYPQTPVPTFESVWVALQETDRQMKETDRQMKETDRQMKETYRQIKENDRMLTEKFAETDRQRKENERMLTEKFEKTEKLIADMQKEIGGVSNSNGKIAESYFINSFENSMYFAGQEYDSLAHNLRKKSKKMNRRGEFDLVCSIPQKSDYCLRCIFAI